MRSIPPACLDLVRAAEGLRLTAYPDPATGGAPWTIGYGHTGSDVRPGLTITEDRADELLRVDLDRAAAIVDRAVLVPLTDAQFGALVSFAFNVGAGAKGVKDGLVTLKSGKPSTLLAKLNTGDYAGAAAEFPKWTRGAGKVMAGLVKRRAAETALFLSEDEHTPTRSVEPAPTVKAVTASASGLSGVGALGLGGVAVALDQAREVSAAARGLLESLPSGALGWCVALMLAAAVAALLIRQRSDQRKAAA